MLCYMALFKDLFEKEGEVLGLRITASALGENGETFALSSQDSEVMLQWCRAKSQEKSLLSALEMTYSAASLAVSQLYHTAGCAPM